MLEFVKNLLKKKKKVTTNLDDEAREASITTRRLNAELKQINHQIKMTQKQRELELEKVKLNQLQEKLYGESDEDQIESMVMNMLMSSLMQKNPNITSAFGASSPATSSTPEQKLEAPVGISLSEEMIKSYVGKIPNKLLKKLKKLPDEQLRTEIINQIPDLSKESEDIAISIIKN